MKKAVFIALLVFAFAALAGDRFMIEKSTAVSAVALSWTYTIPSDCEVDHVWVSIDPAPTTSENVTISVTPLAGGVAEVFREVDPTTLPAMDDGRAMVVERSMQAVPYREGAIVTVTYTNTDAGDITAGFSGWGYRR